jgi:probable rRNA maturation factor
MITRFHFLKKTTLSDRTQLKEFLKKITKKEKCPIASVDFIFCSDEHLLSINRSFLNHDYYTDIITFDLTPKGENDVVAEIYISTERVKENAILYTTTFKRELHRVIFHGILHLCGYKDKKAAQQKTMRGKEEEYLNLYFKN